VPRGLVRTPESFEHPLMLLARGLGEQAGEQFARPSLTLFLHISGARSLYGLSKVWLQLFHMESAPPCASLIREVECLTLCTVPCGPRRHHSSP